MPSAGSTNERGYGAKHKRLRKHWAPKVATGTINCWRCNQPIHTGQQWDLGHDDHDRTQYRGPEHAKAADCLEGGNRATSGRRPPQTKAAALGFFAPDPQGALGA